MEINAEFWNQVKSKIKARNSNNKLIESYIDPILFLEKQDNSGVPKIVLGVPSKFLHYYISNNLLDRICSEISDSYRGIFDIDLKVTQSNEQAPEIQGNFEEIIQTQEDKQKSSLISQTLNSQSSQQSDPSRYLNPDYTFNTFVVGKNNEFAHAACYNIAQNPGTVGYNPLFICGPVGMGKTHMLHAVGNQIKQSFPSLRITYVSAATFLNECVASIRNKTMDQFRFKYRENLDVLLVDDIQFLRGESTQEEFFHAINSLLERKCQIVVACDRMPKDINGLEDRIRSRLEWGLIADITMPDFETRVAILRYKAEKLNVKLSDEVANYIARISKTSIRQLEGNLNKVKMLSELQGIAIDLEMVKRYLASHETHSAISIEDIQKMVSDHYKVKISDLKSASRAKPIVLPRQIAMYLIKKHIDKSLIDIGRAFGDRDHTTVMNALDKIKNLHQKDQDIKNDIEELTTRIHNITGL